MIRYLYRRLGEQSTHTGFCMMAIMATLGALHFKVPLADLKEAVQHAVGILIALGGLSAAMKVLLPETKKPEIVVVPADSIMSGEGGMTLPPKV